MDYEVIWWYAMLIALIIGICIYGYFDAKREEPFMARDSEKRLGGWD